MKVKMLALTAALCLSLSACSSSPTYLTEEQSIAKRTVIMASGSDIDNLAVRSIIRDDGLVQVALKGQGTSTRTVYVKIIWEDSNGMTINTALSAWQKKKIISGQPVSWTFIAPNKSATNYQIIITDNIGDGTLNV